MPGNTIIAQNAKQQETRRSDSSNDHEGRFLGARKGSGRTTEPKRWTCGAAHRINGKRLSKNYPIESYPTCSVFLGAEAARAWGLQATRGQM